MFGTIKNFYRKYYLVTALIIFLLVLLFGFIVVENLIQGERSDFALITLQTIMAAIIIGLIIDILERMASAQKTKSLVDEIDKRVQDTLTRGLVHGFRLIHESANEIDKIEQISPGGKVWWANTVIRNQDKAWDAIKRALERGVSVRLLLMHKENQSREYRGRDTCKYYDDNERINRDIERYKRNLETQQSNFIDRYQNYKDDKKNDVYKGSLSIRFYKDSPGLPMFILESDKTTTAFSGFYLDDFSSKFPYIEWVPRDEDEEVALFNNLKNYFEKKWYFAEDGDVENFEQSTLDS